MVLEVAQEIGENILVVRLGGTVTRDDYLQFLPEAESLIARCGRIRILVDMRDFHGWTLEAFWEDIKFDWKHYSDIERLAMVGETKWQEWMASFCQPFTKAEVAYFSQEKAADAWDWIEA